MGFLCERERESVVCVCVCVLIFGRGREKALLCMNDSVSWHSEKEPVFLLLCQVV